MTKQEEIVKAIRDYLEDRGVCLVAYEEDVICPSFGFTMLLSGPAAFAQYVIHVFSDDYIVLAVCPLSVDSSNPAAIGAISLFLHYANFGMKEGAFELDCQKGEIRFKYYVDCYDRVPSRLTVWKSIDTPSSMLTKYIPGMVRVLYQGTSPKEAVEACKSEESENLRSLIKELIDTFGPFDEDEDDESDNMEALIKGAIGVASSEFLNEYGEPSQLPSYEEFLRMTESESDGIGSEDSEDDDAS